MFFFLEIFISSSILCQRMVAKFKNSFKLTSALLMQVIVKVWNRKNNCRYIWTENEFMQTMDDINAFKVSRVTLSPKKFSSVILQKRMLKLFNHEMLKSPIREILNYFRALFILDNLWCWVTLNICNIVLQAITIKNNIFNIHRNKICFIVSVKKHVFDQLLHV